MIVGIAAGGTGGHIIPALHVAKALIENGHQCIWFGRKDSLESRLAATHNIQFVEIHTEPMKRTISSLMTLIWRMFISIKSIRKQLKAHKISTVFGTGAYVSLPTAIAAKLSGIPLVIHEQNTHMGMANSLLKHIANRVCLGMPIEGMSDEWHVGIPLSTEITEGEKTHLLVVGGSQGARFLNESLPRCLSKLGYKGKVIHIAGRQFQAVQNRYKDLDIQAEVHQFVDNMDMLYSQSTLAVTRAGAMTLAELAQYGIPGILVPYPHAKADHQRKNAAYFVQNQAAIMIDEKICELEAALKTLLSMPSKQVALSDSVRKLHKASAVNDIMRILEQLHA